MNVRVKICGINSAAALDAAAAAGADCVGFVFFAKSPRHVTPEQAGALAARLSNGPARVGLFVNPTEADVAAALARVRLDALQVYGTYDVAALKARFGLPVWRPVGVSGPGDLPVDCGGADLLLLEAKPPEGATRPGGNAVTFDWALLRGWQAPCPWMLAGGLHPGNVAEAIRATGAMGVDVSSGVESAPGVKDAGLIRAFVAAARGA